MTDRNFEEFLNKQSNFAFKNNYILALLTNSSIVRIIDAINVVGSINKHYNNHKLASSAASINSRNAVLQRLMLLGACLRERAEEGHRRPKTLLEVVISICSIYTNNKIVHFSCLKCL